MPHILPHENDFKLCKAFTVQGTKKALEQIQNALCVIIFFFFPCYWFLKYLHQWSCCPPASSCDSWETENGTLSSVITADWALIRQQAHSLKLQKLLAGHSWREGSNANSTPTVAQQESQQ